jgi:arsenate reductase (glutaredoxin)
MITVYGIPNCDTIKKTLDWLKAHKVDHVLHNYKTEGISKDMLSEWSKQVDWKLLLNKQSTTWRGLTEAQQAKATAKAGALKLLSENPSMIKRPVLVKDGKVLAVGFNAALLESLL